MASSALHSDLPFISTHLSKSFDVNVRDIQAIAWSKEETLYISTNNCIVEISPVSNHILKVITSIGNKYGSICVDEEGLLYAINATHGCIEIYKDDMKIAEWKQDGKAPYYSITVGRHGNILVLTNGVVKIFSVTGRLMRTVEIGCFQLLIDYSIVGYKTGLSLVVAGYSSLYRTATFSRYTSDGRKIITKEYEIACKNQISNLVIDKYGFIYFERAGKVTRIKPSLERDEEFSSPCSDMKSCRLALNGEVLALASQKGTIQLFTLQRVKNKLPELQAISKSVKTVLPSPAINNCGFARTKFISQWLINDARYFTINNVNTIYVTGYRGKGGYIAQYSMSEGKQIRVIGGIGDEYHGLAVTDQGHLLVSTDSAVKQFISGDMNGGWTLPYESPRRHEFVTRKQHMIISRDNTLFVYDITQLEEPIHRAKIQLQHTSILVHGEQQKVELDRHYIQHLAPTNNGALIIYQDSSTVLHMDMLGEEVWRYDGIIAPKGLAVDNLGYIYVGDAEKNRVIQLSPDGKKELDIVTSLQLAGESPWDVKVFNDILIVRCSGGRKFKKYSLQPK